MRVILGVAMALMTQSCASAEAVRATVCELSQHPERYASQHVEVTARVGGGGEHDLLLVDANCPKDLIALSIANDSIDKPDIKPLWTAVYREGFIGTVGKHTTGAFTGKYLPQDDVLMKGTLELESVRNLDVKLSPSPN